MSDSRFTDHSVKNFAFGFNSGASPVLLAPGELSVSDNFMPDVRGAISKRTGIAKYNATEIAANKGVLGLIRFYRDNATDAFVAVCDSKLWTVPTTGASTDLGLDHDGNSLYVLSSSATSRTMVQYMDRIYGISWKAYNEAGSNYFVIAEHPSASSALLAWEAGVHPPTNALTHTVSGTGVNGVRKYTYSYFYGESAAHGESNTCPAILTTASLTNDMVTLTIFGAGKDYADWAAAHDAGIDKVRIYRTEAGGSDYYFLADVTSGLTYDDSTDADDTTAVPQTDNYDAPQAAMCIAVSKSRMLLGNLLDGGAACPRRVRWSLPGYPDIFPAQNYADVPGDIGEVRAIVDMAGSLYVLCELGVCRLTIVGAADYVLETVWRGQGPSGPSVVSLGTEAEVPYVYFLTEDGHTFRFDGVATVPLWHSGGTLASTTAFCLWDGEYWRWNWGTSKIERRYCSSVRRTDDWTGSVIGTWWSQTFLFALSCACSAIVSGVQGVYYGAAGTGYIYRPTTNKTDNAVGYTATATTGYMDFEMPGQRKRLVKILVDSSFAVSSVVTWISDPPSGSTGDFTTVGGAWHRDEYDVPGQVDFRRVSLSIAVPADENCILFGFIVRVGSGSPD